MTASAPHSLSDYEIYEEIGRGRHSVVYRGRKHFTLEFVAVKSIDRQHSSRIKCQVSLLKQMTHLNVMAFHTWYQTPNNFWICSEYCAGGNLLNLLKQDHELPESCLRPFARDIACGLHYVHSRGVIFCDLKPSNILLTEYAVLKLCDFGMARTLKNDFTEKQFCRSRRGTPHYMSPEQFEAKPVYTYATDIWSFGCVLYEMACGLPPFPQWPMKDLIQAIKGSPIPTLPPHLSDAFIDLVTRCLEKSPGRRISWPEICTHPFWASPLPILFESRQDEEFAIQANPSVALYPKPVISPSDISRTEADSVQVDFNRSKCDRVASDEDEGALTGEEEDEAEDDELLQTLRPNISRQGPIVLGEHSKNQSQQVLIRRQTISHIPLAAKSLAIEDLIEHECDIMVRPLVGNSRIEKSPSLACNSSSLPFPALPIDSLLLLTHTELEKFLKEVYRSLDRKSSTVLDRVNILKYFIPLCTNTGFANCIINSGIMSMFIQQSSTEPSPESKLYFIYAMGTLIRYASFVGSHLQSAGVFEVLSGLSRHPNVKVKRQAIAALGELLFYVATREGSQSSPAAVDAEATWTVPACVLLTIVKSLRAGEDDTVRHYAAKTVENIAAQSPSYSLSWFCSAEVILAFVQIFQSTSNKSLRVTSASALSQTLRRSPLALFKKVLPRFGWMFLIGGLEVDSLKCQQAFFNLIIHAIANRIAPLDFDPTDLMEFCIRIIENSASIIRAKALLTLALVFSRHPNQNTHILYAFKHRLNNALDRSMKDKDDYVQKSLLFFVKSITTSVQALFERIHNAICSTKDNPVPLQVGIIAAFPVISSCATSPVLMHAAITSNSLQWLANIIASFSSNNPGPATVPITDVLYVVEAVSANPDLLMGGVIPGKIVHHLLPALISVFSKGKRECNHDNVMDGTRFFCIKLTTDILAILLPNLYDRGQLSNQLHSPTTTSLHTLMMKDILPLVPSILTEKDPIPQYGIRLLSVMVDANRDLVATLKMLGLIPLFMDMLSICEQVTLGNVQIVRAIVCSGHADLHWLYSMDLIVKVNNVLAYSFGRSADLLSEPILDIMLYLIEAENDNAPIEPILDNAEIMLSFMLQNDDIMCEKGSACVLALVQRYPESHFLLWSSSNALAAFGAALRCTRSNASITTCVLNIVSCLVNSSDTRVHANFKSKKGDDCRLVLQALSKRDLDVEVHRKVQEILNRM